MNNKEDAVFEKTKERLQGRRPFNTEGAPEEQCKRRQTMNGFTLLAATQRKAVEDGLLSKEEAEKKCRVYDFLATCDQEDFYNLFDTSAFNEISKSYMRLAVKELVAEGKIDKDQGRAVRNRFNILFDEKSSKEAFEADS